MDSTRTTTRDIRRHNRSVLLSKLFFDGPLSRLELSQLTGLSSATVSTVTGELIDDRLIVEAGHVESGGGRPRVLLRVDPAYGYVVGVDVGETGVTVELFDLGMVKRGAVVRPLESVRPTPAEVVEEVVAGIRDVLSGGSQLLESPSGAGFARLNGTVAARQPVPAARDGVEADEHAAARTDGADEPEPEPVHVDPGLVIGIGIGVPGIVEQGDTVLVHAATIGWESVALVDMLRARGVTAPVFVGNGAKTQAQAEMWFGAARGARHAIIALVGSGVGAAVITDGVPFQGTSSSAGEWGHTTLVYGGRDCRCGARGCLEAYVGAESIIERYAEAHGAPPPHPAGTDEVTEFEALLAAPDARDFVSETAGYLGAAIGNLVNLFNPERVVLGGWAGLALGAVKLDEIRAAARAQALTLPYAQVSIELSELGADAVAFGAATLPLAALLTRGEDPRLR